MHVPQNSAFWRSQDLWFGTAAEDIAFRFRSAHWTHSTDPKIDNERAKVVDDLAFTGCLEAAGLLTRNSPDLSQGGERKDLIGTDGHVAVLRLKDCGDRTSCQEWMLRLLFLGEAGYRAR